MNKFYLGLSSFIGGILAVLADLNQKSDASAILNIGNNLASVFNIPGSAIVATLLILLIAIALALIFDVSSNRQAFYTGASVLSLMMILVPYKTPDGFKTVPNSVEVVLTLKTADNKPIQQAVVSLWYSDGRTLLSSSKISNEVFRFYKDGGSYKLSVEMEGYSTQFVDLTLQEGRISPPLTITLQPSGTPLFLQRLIH